MYIYIYIKTNMLVPTALVQQTSFPRRRKVEIPSPILLTRTRRTVVLAKLTAYLLMGLC